MNGKNMRGINKHYTETTPLSELKADSSLYTNRS